MTRQLEALPPETDLPAAARKMLGSGIHRLLVMEEDRLCGIVSTMDFLRLVAAADADAPAWRAESRPARIGSREPSGDPLLAGQERSGDRKC